MSLRTLHQSPNGHGNRCFIMNRWEDDIWDGAMDGAIQSTEGERELWTLQQGPCTPPGPGFYTESFRNEGFVEGTVLGRSGTFRYACQGKFYLDEPKRWESNCLLYEGTGELAGLHGRMQEHTYLETGGTTGYEGEVHFDPDK